MKLKLDSIDKASKDKLKLVVVITILVVALFVVTAITYINRFGNALVEENANYLSEITEHMATNVNTVILNMEKTLESVGLTISLAMEDSENKPYLNSLKEKYDFEYVGVASFDGNLISTMASEEKNISSEPYYIKSMAGESVIQYVPIKIFQNKVISGILISAPMYNSAVSTEKPVGVLLAMLDMSKFSEAAKISSFDGQSAIYVIDEKGTIILQTKKMDRSNLFAFLESVDFKDGYSLSKMRQDLTEKKAGFTICSDFGIEKFIHYRYLGSAGWSVISVIERDIITAQTTQLTKELSWIAVAVMFLFPLLFIFAISSLLISQASNQTTQAKTAFLANMSHEIRTPMNAIVGISEILMREELTTKQKNYVSSIINAGNGLLAIINDILDISKIESGKFSIVEEEYELESLIYDIVAIIAVKLNNKPVEFIVDMDTNLPKRLVGDMLRVKQVLINIIGNAAKFTQSGYIKLGIYGKTQDGQIILTMPVEDSGIGIQKADLDKLFVSFSQVDTHKNRNIEGTGLGLVISKRLCSMMGGDITVKSVYGEGSTFTIHVKQRVVNPEKMMHLPEQAACNILILEQSQILQKHCSVCLNRMNLPYVFCEDYLSFLSKAKEGHYTHALAAPAELNKLKEDIDDMEDMLGLMPIAFIGLKQHNNTQDYSNTIIGPLFTMQLAAILCNRHEPASLLKRSGLDIISIVPMPFVKVLLVDDNEVNLQVANGLMNPYHMMVDCALSGAIAIAMIKVKDYDLIFMDHMMPEMDGVEAVSIIRSLDESKKNVPIIALTANVTEDAKSLFMVSGFNGFLSKPIDTVKLNTILRKWLKEINETREREHPEISKEILANLQKLDAEDFPSGLDEQFEAVNCLDFALGISKLGSTEVYCSILVTYLRSAEEKLLHLPKLLEKDLKQFTIEIHGLKGASSGIYANLIAEAAAELEHLAKEGQLEKIKEKLPVFLSALKGTLVVIEKFISIYKAPILKSEAVSSASEIISLTQSDLADFKEALWAFDSEKLDELFAHHAKFSYITEDNELLEKLRVCHEAYEYEGSIPLIEAYEQTNLKGGV